MSIIITKPILSSAGQNTDTTISGGNWSANTYTGQVEQIERQYIVTSIQTDGAGTLYYDFSVDGTNVSTFPPAGISVAAGIHNYKWAHKALFRHFNTRFVADDASRTYFRLYTEYTDTPPSFNSPVSFGVTGDDPSMTVKALLHGENESSLGTYVSGKMTSGGAIKTSIVSSLISFVHDYFIEVDVSTTTDRYDYYVGGASGTKVAEVLVTYKSTSKNEVLSSGVTII